jgi:hypothetical protein
VLVGDLDTVVPVEEVRKVAALFPGSTFVPVAEVGHTTLGSGQCAAGLTSEFFETLQVGDTTCAKTPETVWPALGRFPLMAADARPAEIDPDGQNEIGEHERRVVTVAVSASAGLKLVYFTVFFDQEFERGLISDHSTDEGHIIKRITLRLQDHLGHALWLQHGALHGA